MAPNIQRQALWFEGIGILFISVLGSLLHFVYAWSGEIWWVAIFAAVNESVWEHLKLAFWPALLWSLIGWYVIGGSLPNFWVGRAAALLLMPLVITFGFYGYTALLGDNYFPLDLSLFVLAVIAGQIAAMVRYRAAVIGVSGQLTAIGLILISCICFGSLTFFPPDFPLFLEPGD